MKIKILFIIFILAIILASCHVQPSLETSWEISATPWDQQVEVNWAPQAGVAYYNLYWSESPTFELVSGHKIGNVVSPYLHKSLTNGKTYYYKITAVEGEYEEIVTGIAEATPRQLSKRFTKFIAVIAQPGDTPQLLAGKFLLDESKWWVITEFNQTKSVKPGQELIIPLYDTEKGGLTPKRYQTIPVLTYHRFMESEPKTKKEKRQFKSLMWVIKKDFEQQMKYLYENGYNVVSIKELVDFLDFKTQLPQKSVLITIDDGFKSVHTIALPILKKYGFNKATLFVYTDLIEKEKVSLTWDEVREISDYMDIQYHTKSHRDLRFRSKFNIEKRRRKETFKQYFDSILEEFSVSGRKIFKELNKDCEYLAYPYGGSNHLVIAMARKFGYKAAFTVKRGGNSFFAHNFRIRRDMVFGKYDMKRFKKILNRRYSSRALRK